MPGFHNKYREIYSEANTVARVPRLHDEHGDDGAQFPTSENEEIRPESRKLLESEQLSARVLSWLIGKMTVAHQVIPLAPLFYRHLQMDLASALRATGQDYK